MATVSVTRQVNAPADAVWQMVGGWNSLPQWHPEVSTSALESDGLIRRVRLADGTEIRERLEHFARAGRQYTYIITESPLPLSFYRSTLRVQPEEVGALATWFTEFETAGAPAEEMAETLRAFYTAGLANLDRILAGR
jgi:Polyketide cyclase / dehydrase and lipid transport.